MKEGPPQEIGLDSIMERIRERVPDDFDVVVAVERGGVLPGYLAARYLDIPLEYIKVRFRDDTHTPLYEKPELISKPKNDLSGKRVLLTDDVANSGASLKRAAEALPGAQCTTLVISGNADISLFGPHDRCIRWPWQ